MLGTSGFCAALRLIQASALLAEPQIPPLRPGNHLIDPCRHKHACHKDALGVRATTCLQHRRELAFIEQSRWHSPHPKGQPSNLVESPGRGISSQGTLHVAHQCVMPPGRIVQCSTAIQSTMHRTSCSLHRDNFLCLLARWQDVLPFCRRLSGDNTRTFCLPVATNMAAIRQ